LFGSEYVESQLWGSPPSTTRSLSVAEGQGKSGLPNFQVKPRLLRIKNSTVFDRTRYKEKGIDR